MDIGRAKGAVTSFARVEGKRERDSKKKRGVCIGPIEIGAIGSQRGRDEVAGGGGVERQRGRMGRVVGGLCGERGDVWNGGGGGPGG